MRVPIAVRALPAVAEKLWWTPPHIRSLSLDGVLETDGFVGVAVPWEDVELSGFEIGDGPVVVLVHGWGGQAAQMAPLAGAIADGGMKAVAIDLPGHGRDDGARSDAFQMASALDALVDVVGWPVGVVAHSLGSVATLMAFNEGLPERTVLVAPVLDIEHAVTVFADRARLFPWTARRIRSRFMSFVGDHWWQRLTMGSDTDLGATDLFVVHDVGDRETPFDTSAALAAKHPGAAFMATSSLGHSRLLTDGSVTEAVRDFLAPSTRRESHVGLREHQETVPSVLRMGQSMA